MFWPLGLSVLALIFTTPSAFVPSGSSQKLRTVLQSSLQEVQKVESDVQAEISGSEVLVQLTVAEYNARLAAQLEKMRSKDTGSKALTKEDLKIVYEDSNIVVVNKPTGVLTVAGKVKENPNLAKVVFDNVETDLPTCDHMVVHRLGMDTSGVIALAKNMDGLRGMNTAFRTRKVERTYEALVAGHMAKTEGIINLPLMRDFECPPFVRVSTRANQWALLSLEEEGNVEKKVLERPKGSLTKYLVLSREEFNGHPVTRVKLTSLSGRYHQLNCHMAAFGHPIVGDLIYGYGGQALPNGGLSDDELEELAPNPARASVDLQKALLQTAQERNMPPCVHAKSIKFLHPVLKQDVEFHADCPF